MVSVRIKVRVRARVRECTSCTFFPSDLCVCGEHLCLQSLARYTVSVSAHDGLLMDIQ